MRVPDRCGRTASPVTRTPGSQHLEIVGAPSPPCPYAVPGQQRGADDDRAARPFGELGEAIGTPVFEPLHPRGRSPPRRSPVGQEGLRPVWIR